MPKLMAVVRWMLRLVGSLILAFMLLPYVIGAWVEPGGPGVEVKRVIWLLELAALKMANIAGRNAQAQQAPQSNVENKATQDVFDSPEGVRWLKFDVIEYQNAIFSCKNGHFYLFRIFPADAVGFYPTVDAELENPSLLQQLEKRVQNLIRNYNDCINSSTFAAPLEK